MRIQEDEFKPNGQSEKVEKPAILNRNSNLCLNVQKGWAEFWTLMIVK